MADPDEDLEAAVGELAETLRALRHELEPNRRGRVFPGFVPDDTRTTRRNGPRRVFRPPTPGELLRAADEVAIPALIAILEANVRALEAFQRGIQLVRTGQDVRDRTAELGEDTRTRARTLRETTLERIDGALADLQRATADGSLPADGEARELIERARDLRDTVDEQIRDATLDARDGRDGRLEPDSRDDRSGLDARNSRSGLDARDEGYRIEIEDGAAAETDAGTPTADAVDVDAELETLREQYGTINDGTDGESDDSADADDDDATEAPPDVDPASPDDEDATGTDPVTPPDDDDAEDDRSDGSTE